MTDQNSTEQPPVSTEEATYRPEQVMELLGIKQQAYYNRIDFLGIEVAKDNSRKAYLSQEQFDLMQRLDQHIKASGTMDGFILGAVAQVGGDLAIAGEAGLMGENLPVQQTEEVQPGIDEQLIRMAAQLKAQQLAMTPEIIRSLAAQMTEDDLPEDLRAMVKGSREAIAPKMQPSQLASQMLNQRREQRKSDLVTA